MSSPKNSYLRDLPVWVSGVFELPRRLPGDVSVPEIAARSGYSERGIRSILKQAARAGKIDELWVYDSEHPRRRIMIYRPKPGVANPLRSLEGKDNLNVKRKSIKA